MECTCICRVVFGWTITNSGFTAGAKIAALREDAVRDALCGESVSSASRTLNPMIFPRFMRLMLVLVMLLIGGGVAGAAHWSQEHSEHPGHVHDTDRCALCFFVMHGQARPAAPTLGVAFIVAVAFTPPVRSIHVHVCPVRTSRHARAPPLAA